MLWLEFRSSMDWYVFKNFGISTTFSCTIDALGDSWDGSLKSLKGTNTSHSQDDSFGFDDSNLLCLLVMSGLAYRPLCLLKDYCTIGKQSQQPRIRILGSTCIYTRLLPKSSSKLRLSSQIAASVCLNPFLHRKSL